MSTTAAASPKPAATQLGELIASTRYEDLPAEVQTSAKMRILNTAAAAFAGRNTPASQLALSFAKGRQSAGPATFWLGGGRGSVEDVVFTNGVVSHSALLNDMMGGHMGCAVPPAALAVAEVEGSSGRDILTSIVLGYEIAGRVDASGYLTSANTKRGVRLSSATWNLGPAATAAYLMKLPASGVSDALAVSVGALCAPGTYEVIGRHGTTERFVQLGGAVRDGVFAAQLARGGFTGTDTAFEGEAGFYFVWTGKAEAPRELLDQLGTRWHITEAILKPYGAGATNNFVVYATEQLIRRRPIAYDEIAEVTVRTTDWKHMLGVIDAGPFDDFEQAHVSCPFAVAVMLVFGSYDVSAILKGIGDRRVNDLARRVKMTIGEPGAAHHLGGNRLTSKYGEVTVTLRDGAVLESNALSMPDSMIKPNWDQMVERFHHLTSETLPQDQRDAIVETVAGFDEAADCHRLAKLLAQAGT